jgi:TonB family protein
MRQAVSIAPGLLITLALFFLMQLMIAGSMREVDRLDMPGGVGLVTLKLDSMDRGTAVVPSSLQQAESAQSVAAPPSPELAELALPVSEDTELPTELPALDTPTIEALPFLGEPPVLDTKRPPQPARPRETNRTARAADRSARETQREASRSRSAGDIIGEGKPDAGGGGGRSGSASGSGSGDSGVVVLSRPKPTYPRDAARRGEEGWVKVAFTITVEGTVTEATIVAARPQRVFERSALAAIERWRFRPKVVAGQPVRSRATQLIEFSLASQ